MRVDSQILHAGVGGQDERDDGPQPPSSPLLFEEMRNRAGAGRFAGERLLNRGGERGAP
jgi:hypothetical protein